MNAGLAYHPALEPGPGNTGLLILGPRKVSRFEVALSRGHDYATGQLGRVVLEFSPIINLAGTTLAVQSVIIADLEHGSPGDGLSVSGRVDETVTLWSGARLNVVAPEAIFEVGITHAPAIPGCRIFRDPQAMEVVLNDLEHEQSNTAITEWMATVCQIAHHTPLTQRATA